MSRGTINFNESTTINFTVRGIKFSVVYYEPTREFTLREHKGMFEKWGKVITEIKIAFNKEQIGVHRILARAMIEELGFNVIAREV